MYALFDGDKQIGNAFANEGEVWKAALKEGLVKDVPVADEEGGQLLPKGYHVAKVENHALQKQADRADGLADETVDDEVRETLRTAAQQYREKARE
jgi:hypothetical protein